MTEYKRDYLHGAEFVRRHEKFPVVYVISWGVPSHPHYVVHSRDLATRIAGGLVAEGKQFVEMKTSACVDWNL